MLKPIIHILIILSVNLLFNIHIHAKHKCEPKESKTELFLKEKSRSLINSLKSSGHKLKHVLFNSESIEVFDKNQEEITGKIFDLAYSSKIQFYKLIRNIGLNLKIKAPLDLDLTQAIIDEYIKTGDAVIKTDFSIEYHIEIKPNLKTGDVYRFDSIVFVPRVTASEMVDNFNVSGTLSSSYIYTLSRRYKGYLDNETSSDDVEEYIRPIREVLTQTPFFFKPRCDQTRTEYITNLLGNLNIPSTFDKLDKLLLDQDTLTYQKKSALGLGASVTNVKNFVRLRAGVRRARIVTLNKIIHKTIAPYPTYHMKTFLDSEDIILEGEISIKSGVFHKDFVSWKPLNKALKKPLSKRIAEIRLGKKEQQTYLSSFYIALNDPQFKKVDEHLQNVKKAYNNFVQNNFKPSWSHLKQSTYLLFAKLNRKSRKTFLDNQLREILQPLFKLAEESKVIISKNKLFTREINTPQCEKIKLHPLTNYFTGTKDVVEEYFNFRLNLFKLAEMKYEKNWKDKFYSFFNQDGTIEYFTQSLLNLEKSYKGINFINVFDNIKKTVLKAFLSEKKYRHWITAQNKNRQLYAITQANENQEILSFKTLGYNFSLKSTYFADNVFSEQAFYENITRVFPVGEISNKIKENYFKIRPSIINKEAYLGYKFLLSQRGFDYLSKKITYEVVTNNNFNYIYNIFKQCMNKKDPNYSNSEACIGHNLYYTTYLEQIRNQIFRDEKNIANFRQDPELMDEIIESISTKLTFILLDNDYFYHVVDRQGDHIKKMFYLSNLVSITKDKIFRNINNAKYSLFNSLMSDNFKFMFRAEKFAKEKIVFRDVAHILLPYILYYSFPDSNYKNFQIDKTEVKDLDKYLHIYALFRSIRYNTEYTISPDGVLNEDTFKVLRRINFFDFNFNNLNNMNPFCEENQSDIMTIETLGS